jgi:ABC-2 type transport system permease protein
VNGFKALLKKELREQWRTYKLLIVGGLFLFFGISTPLILNYLPHILELSGENVNIEFPPPTAIESLNEFAATIAQVGVLAAVLIAMGAIAREKERGTAAMLLVKPVGREAFVVSKLVATSAVFIVALVLGAAACYTYTVMLIESGDLGGFIVLTLLMVLFLVFCLAVTLLYSSVFRSSLLAGGVALATLIGQSVLTQLPLIGDFVPGSLAAWNVELLSGQPANIWPSIIVTFVLIAACVYFSAVVLRRREI